MYHILMTNLPVEGHLGCFYLLVIVNQAARNIAEQKSVEDEEYFGHTPGTGIVESHCRFTFSDFFFFFEDAQHWQAEWIHQCGFPQRVNEFLFFTTS